MGETAELQLARCVYSMLKKHEQGEIIKLFLMNLVAVSLLQGDQKQKLRTVRGFKAFQEALNWTLIQQEEKHWLQITLVLMFCISAAGKKQPATNRIRNIKAGNRVSNY